MKKYILSIMFLSVYSMDVETSPFNNLAKLTKKEQITGYGKHDFWKGLGWSAAALALIHGINQLYKKRIRFLKKINCYPTEEYS